MYGHSWPSDDPPQSSQALGTCDTIYVLDTAIIAEDEYLSAVDGWMGGVSTVYANVSSPNKFAC